MMRKAICTLCAMLLLFGALCPAALADGLKRVVPSVDLSQFERYAGFKMDELTGTWSLTSNQADAMLRSVRGEGFKQYKSSGAAVFYVQIEGDAGTGRYAPYLYALYTGPELNATAISIRVGDIRYDLAVQSEITPLDGKPNPEKKSEEADEKKDGEKKKEKEKEEDQMEQLRAPLDGQGLQMVAAMRDAGQATIRLHGDKCYTTRLKRKKTYSSGKQRLESMALDSVDVERELEILRDAEYRLRDHDFAVWAAKTGVAPQLVKTDLSTELLPEGKGVPTLDKDLHMLSSGSSNKQVGLLNAQLVEMRLLAGKAGSKYTKDTQAAVRGIQKMYGLVPTGSADGRLLSILFGGEIPESPGDQAASEPISIEGGTNDAQPGAVYVLQDAISLLLDGYWGAEAVETSRPADVLSRIATSDRNRPLLIASGRIKNLTGKPFALQEIAANVLIHGVSYPMTLRAEADGGSRFGGELLPMEEVRLVLYAQVPEGLLTAPQDAYIAIEWGDALRYALG